MLPIYWLLDSKFELFNIMFLYKGIKERKED